MKVKVTLKSLNFELIIRQIKMGKQPNFIISFGIALFDFVILKIQAILQGRITNEVYLFYLI